MEPQRVLRVGDVIEGKYRVERVLGQGGMGVVVAARHLGLDELFAIKLLLPQVLGDATAVERFMREARAAARLKSDHVVRVNDVGRLPDGAPFLVMELLQGQDLSQLVAERGALAPAHAIQYVLQACDAVAEAHGNGVVHRDLKPANLFLTHRLNGTPCIKVLDFGISKQMDPTSPAMTKTSAVMGTPYYMSPEQMRSSKIADARTDIWAFGVILYELTTASVPYEGESVTEVVAKVLSEEPMPPSRRANIPLPLEQVILSCLVRDPNRRYQTVKALAQALSTLAADPAIQAWPPPPRATQPRGPSVPPTSPEPLPGSTAPSGPVTAPSWPPGAASGQPPSVQPTSWQAPSFQQPPSSGMPVAAWPTPGATMPGGGGLSTPAVQLPPRASTSRSGMVVVPIVALLGLGAAGAGGWWWWSQRTADDKPKAASTATATASATSSGAPATPEKNKWIAVTPPTGAVVLGLPGTAGKDAIGFRAARSVAGPSARYDIQQHEVTWGELEPWLAENPAQKFDKPAWVPAADARLALPATGVPWESARQYCRSIGGQLPTEEEWEYAARGSALRPQPWGAQQIDLARTHAFAGAPAKGKKRSAPTVVAVMTSDQDVTPESVYDLGGNALEWTADLFRESEPGLDESWVQEGGRTFRAIRGLPLELDPPAPLPAFGAAYRDALCATGDCPPATKDILQTVGFRCVRKAQ
jgi:eukaryotic-like serine/threonine-protein kinase